MHCTSEKKKKNEREEMLIERIIEFESKVPGFLVVHTLAKLVIFLTKQKSPRQIFE